MFWPELLPQQALGPDARHHFRGEIAAHTAVSHVRFDIYPDGGVSRLRLRGTPA
jgi:allantoicase